MQMVFIELKIELKYTYLVPSIKIMETHTLVLILPRL